VKRVVIRGDNEFGGVQFYDKNGLKLLEAGNITSESTEFILQNGHRLIGLKSKVGFRDTPRMEDLVFVIGYLCE
jgi:hypothetical protein